MPVIYLYAEVLTHIRQLSLYASLQTEKNEHTKVLISSDKKIITALHDGESASIYLPTQISGTAKITFPLKRRTEISTRLHIEDLEELKTIADKSSNAEVPWGAGQMTSTAGIRCKTCKDSILKHGKSLIWKDLPSESWAELMDFWVCHKPHDEHGHEDHAAASKGVSAQSKFVSKPGVGFIDPVSFVMNADDLKGLKVSNGEQKENLSKLQCGNCSAVLGTSNEIEASYRLYKSRISVQKNNDSEYEEFAAATFICAQLLSLIESSITRKVVVHSSTGGSTASGVLLWIFNPDIYYSSSKKGPTAYRAMKVFYKHTENPFEILDDTKTDIEELVILPQDFDELVQALENSTNILPQSARTFQDYQVGLLDRHEAISTGAAAMDQNPLSHKPGDIDLFQIPDNMRPLYE